MNSYVLGWAVGTLIFAAWERAKGSLESRTMLGFVFAVAVACADAYCAWVLYQGGCK